jgi:thiazole synthase
VSRQVETRFHLAGTGPHIVSVDGTISIHINGEHRRVRDGLTLAEADDLGLDSTLLV